MALAHSRDPVRAPVALRAPSPVAPGARVALVCPAGPLRGEEELDRAISNVERLGWEAVPGRNVLARAGYFAGDDSARLDDLAAALDDGSIDAIWCVRGGYGSARLLPHLDYRGVRHRDVTIIGFSDITALHCALGRRAGLATLHGPTARGELTLFSERSLHAAAARAGEPCGSAPDARVLRPGHARGRLAGGNLAVLASLVGTPWMPVLDGAILVLEDINEPVYRVDRMMMQLRLAGLLTRCSAIVFGHCTQCSPESDDGARSLDDVLRETAEVTGIPCVAGVPIGHIDEQWTVPLGTMAELHAMDGDVRLQTEW